MGLKFRKETEPNNLSVAVTLAPLMYFDSVFNWISVKEVAPLETTRSFVP